MKRLKLATVRKPKASRARRRRLRQRQQDTLHFEALEPKQLLAGVTVGNALDVVNAPDLTSITALVNDDGGDGISLREAIMASNNTNGADTISFGSLFDTSQTILLTGGELSITDVLTINGSGQELLSIDAQQNSRVLFFTASTGDLTLGGLTITGGLTTGQFDDGGGIRFVSSGTLTLNSSTVSGNSTLGNDAFGGGINTFTGDVTLINSTVSGNTSGDDGGGIFTSSGDVTLIISTVSGNTSGDDGGGGGIRTYSGAVTLTSSTVRDNSGNTGGGIQTASGDVTLTGSTVRDNSGRAGGGGIRTSSGAVTLTNSTVSGNSATESSIALGGGIFAKLGSVTLTGSIVIGNEAAYLGGGIYTGSGEVTLYSSTVSGNSSGHNGAGIRTFNGDVTLTSSTVSGNNATGNTALGGGIWAFSGAVTLTSSTVSGNSSDGGGGIFTSSGAVTLTNSTVSGNSATGNLADGGGIRTNSGAVTLNSSTVSGNSSGDDGGGIFVGDTFTNPPVTIQNSIVAGNMASGSGPDLFLDPDSTLDIDFSLIGDNTGTTLAEAQTADANGNLIGSAAGGGIIDPLLGPLANNGGLTQTHALLAGSPAIDAGSSTLTTDQRGSIRPLDNPDVANAAGGNGADMGAVEQTEFPSLIVTTATDVVDDTDFLTSLREAIALANSQAGADTIMFGSLFDTPQTILLTGGELFISDTLTITGSGPGAPGLTIDAQQQSRVLNFPVLTGDLTLSGLTITGGLTTGQFDGGGGIRFVSSGTLTLTSSTVSGNSTTGTFANGGGIVTSTGAVTLTSSTVSGNSSGADGGGIFVFDSGTNPPVTIQNSIVAGNMASGLGSDLFLDPGSTLDVDFSLIGDNTDTTLAEAQTADANGNLIGSATGSGIIDPLLGPLANNGGPTLTHALLVGSPAIDAGSSTLTTDQRGSIRPLDNPNVANAVGGNGADMGAVEQTEFPSLIVTTATDVVDATDFLTSLREAIAIANSLTGADTITFGSLFDTSQTILLTGGELFISDTLTITGSGQGLLTIDAQQQSRVLSFTALGDLTLSGLTITGGRTTGPFDDGGGIRFASNGMLTLSSSTVNGNSTNGAFADGGGIFTVSGDVTLSSSTVSGNSTTGSNADGGGILTASGDVTLTSSTVSGNSTTGSNADGGGIRTRYGAVTLTGSTVSGNSSGAAGGGIFVFDTGTNPTVTIQNSIVAGNMASGSGPDLFLDPGSALDIDFSLIGDNTGTTLAEAQTPDANGNLIGSATGSGIIDPLLGGLADNGGPTQTHALLVGSPAIDAGDPAADPGVGNTPLFDQRGAGRVDERRIDIGSFEVQVAPTADIVNVTPDPRNTSVGNVTISFSEDVTGVDIGDFTLTRDGQPVDIRGLSVTQVSDSQFTIDLSAVTGTDGNYELKLNSAGSGIADTAGNALFIDAMDQFMIDMVGPQVESVVVNGSDAQRSVVSELTVTFSEIVSVDANSFVLTNTTTNTQVVPIVTTQVLNGKTVATLTFNGAGIIGGSLADGDYTLTTLDTIVDAAGNQLDGDADGNVGGNATDDFFRYFGDINGDRTVNIIDLFQFRQSFNGKYNAAFDYNGDGVVNIIDLFQFRSRFGTTL